LRRVAVSAFRQAHNLARNLLAVLPREDPAQYRGWVDAPFRTARRIAALTFHERLSENLRPAVFSLQSSLRFLAHGSRKVAAARLGIPNRGWCVCGTLPRKSPPANRSV